MQDFNPWLARGPAAKANGHGVANVERIDQIENLAWQTRAAPPSDHENRLGDALESAFDRGVSELAGLVEHLNQAQLRAPDGAPWSEASLAAELRRLGA